MENPRPRIIGCEPDSDIRVGVLRAHADYVAADRVRIVVRAAPATADNRECMLYSRASQHPFRRQDKHRKTYAVQMDGVLEWEGV